VKRVLLEGLLVAVIGAALAFAANALSPHGIPLAKNHFPGDLPASAHTNPGSRAPGVGVGNTNSPAELLATKLRDLGLQLADSNQVAALFQDPRRQQDWVIFIDARDDEHYAAGHIPNAYLFDRYHPENYLANVVPACMAAQKIVFYCNGGDCDASEHAAIMLRDSLTLPPERVFVYGGGINEWMSNGLPVELGVRGSGSLTNLHPQLVPGNGPASK